MAHESERGPLRRLHKAFQAALIHDLSQADFADTYAQTITYGLLTAAISRTEMSQGRHGTALIAQNVTDMVPITNPFLREMLQTFLKAGGRQGGIDFDELGIQDVVELLRGDETDLPEILRDFGNRTQHEDPVIYFYEYFAKRYDPEEKIRRGEFYTPQPVVSYIVRSVHELLRTEFGLEDGLASTITWAEMKVRHPGIKIPEGTSPQSPFVVILDPATGTATFIVEVIDIVHRTLTAKWKQQRLTDGQQIAAWNDYVPKNLLPRLFGFELKMAPYAIAHMRIGLKLYETGYRFDSPERVRVYLTNSLEPALDENAQLTFAEWVPALAHEAQAVNAIKRDQRFTVVMGNPPYSLLSSNLGSDQRKLVEPYKFIENERIVERGALQFEKNLNDDYVKFYAFCELILRKVPLGILGLITNHSYLDNQTLRGMRWSLLRTFQRLRFLDLHGSQKKPGPLSNKIEDENVFDIQQGVAIALLTRFDIGIAQKTVQQIDLRGRRDEKYRILLERSYRDQEWVTISPTHDRYYFVARDEELAAEYNNGTPVTEIFLQHSLGMITARDDFAISLEKELLLKRVKLFRDDPRSDRDVCEVLGITQKKGWDVRRAREKLREIKDLEKMVATILYRPFDLRYTFYHPSIVWSMARPVMRHMLTGRNIGLCTNRQVNGDFRHVVVTRYIIDDCTLSLATKERTYIFPFRLIPDENARELFDSSSPKLNLSPTFLIKLARTLAVEQDNSDGLPLGISADMVFGYLYSLLNSPTYRNRYSQFLKTDFPRVPLTRNVELFRALAALGRELVALHLMESPVPNKSIIQFIGRGESTVESGFPKYEKKTVWINDEQGFQGVPEEVWEFQIGGYQVCHKWLKDRRGRKLSAEDKTHYAKIVVALKETIRLMKEIDAAIPSWPIE